MKTILLCALSLSAVNFAGNPARIGGFIGNAPKADPRPSNPAAVQKYFPGLSAGPSENRDPYRKSGDRFYSLAPLFKGALTHPSLPGWQKLWGRVAQVGQGGIFIDINNYSRHGDSVLRIFVKNYPYTVADGSAVRLYARRDGAMQYQTILGATATVAQYDYGLPYDPQALAAAAPAATNNVIVITNAPATNAPAPVAPAASSARRSKRLDKPK